MSDDPRVTDVEVAVIGAGVVGLAIAAELSLSGTSVCLIERHVRAGMETSTHNSGVIHAGLYYPEGSLKARLCVEGRDRMYAFCAAHDVPHVKCGKLIVGGSADASTLDALAQTAERNGARLVPVDAAFVRAREPHVQASQALWSPDTGWVAADVLVRTLQALAIERDVAVLLGSPLIGVEPRGDAFTL